MSKAVAWRTGLAFCGALLIVLSALFVFSGSVSASDTGPGEVFSATNGVSEADVVVDFGNGLVVSRHITFTSPITSITALRLAGWDLTLGSGGEVAAIEDVGCPASNPFCYCPPPYDPCLFWAYSHVSEDGQWPYTGDTPGTYLVQDGDVEGYAWGGRTPRPPLNPQIMAAHAALQWLGDQQEDNGSYNSKVGDTVDVIFAVAAGGEDPKAWRSDIGNSMIDYLRSGVSPESYTTQYAGYGPGYAGKLAAGIAAADMDPRDFVGLDLVDMLASSYDPATGSFGTTYAGWQAWAMLGWYAAGETIPVTATQHLAGMVNPDGGWGFPGYDSNPGTPEIDSEPDTTGLVLQALLTAGEPVTSSTVADALIFLKSAQDTTGGFVNNIVNTQSTAWTVQGILSVGASPVSPAWSSVSSQTPISYLLSMQLPNGGFAWDDTLNGANLMATEQIIPALLGKPFPYLSWEVAVRRAAPWIAEQQQNDGGFGGFNAGTTLDAVFAIVAAGYDPHTFVKNGKTPMDYLETQVATYGTSASSLGKMIVGVVAAGDDLRTFGGGELVSDLMTYYQPVTGSFGTGGTTDQAWAILGLVAAGEAVPEKAIEHLISIRFDTSKAWGWAYPGEPSGWCTEADADSTGLALQALAAAGVDRHTEAVLYGIAFLRGTLQEADGAFGYSASWSGTSMNSTGLALQGLAAYGELPRGLGWNVVDGGSPLVLYNPLDTALAYQSASGGFPAGAGGADNASATYQVVPGLAGRPFPLTRLSWVYLPFVSRTLQ